MKRSVANARDQKTTPVRKAAAAPTTTVRTAPATTVRTAPAPVEARAFSAPIVRGRTHDVEAETVAIKRAKSNVKAAEKARDWQRVAYERRALYQMEADLRADKADANDRQRAARNASKKSRIPFWGWWR